MAFSLLAHSPAVRGFVQKAGDQIHVSFWKDFLEAFFDFPKKRASYATADSGTEEESFTGPAETKLLWSLVSKPERNIIL